MQPWVALGVLLFVQTAAAQVSPESPASAEIPPPGGNMTEPQPEEPEQEEAIITPPALPQEKVPLLRSWFPELAEEIAELPPFLADSSLNLRFRTFYFNRFNSNGTQSEAWALGGWLAYKSGWLWDSFAVGATGYTSQPLYAPADTPGTGLLRPPQQPITVLGQAFAQLRYEDYALLTGYRQAVDEGYVGPSDLRMVPNTFQGVTMTGDLGPVGYNVGYLTAIKTLTQQDFENMAKAAGVTTGQNRGLVLTRLSGEPLAGLKLYVANYLVADVFNTTYGKAEFTHRLTDFTYQIGIQYTDQRSNGADLLGRFSTWNASTRGLIIWRGLTVGAALSANGDGSNIRTPYGYSGYLSFQDRSFTRANEKGWGMATRYDFGTGTLLPNVRIAGLAVLVRYGQGTDAIDPVTHQGLPTTRETDLDFTWNIPWLTGLQLRFRNAYVTEGGGPVLKSFRITVNDEIPVL